MRVCFIEDTDLRGGTQFDFLSGVYIALHFAIQMNARHANAAIDEAILADSQHRIRILVGNNAAIDHPVDVAPALEPQITLDSRTVANQG